MDRSYDRVGLSREKPEQRVLTFDRISLRAAFAMPCAPHARKKCEWAAVVEREPSRRLLWLRVGVLAERRPWHDAAVCRPQPSPPVGRLHIANVGDRRAAERSGSGHPPT